MTVPNVLATRYAGADLAEIWSPEHKIVLERRLWLAVLRAQKDLGVDVPDGVIEDYEAVVEKVDLASIPPSAIEAGVERMRVDLGLEQDRGRRFALWAVMHMLGAAPDLDTRPDHDIGTD